MSTTKEVIDRAMQALGIESKRSFSRFLGLSHHRVSSQYSTGKPIPANWLLTLAQRGLCPVWLQTGKGLPFLVHSDRPLEPSTEMLQQMLLERHPGCKIIIEKRSESPDWGTW